MNKQWHEQNPMPAGASFDQRVDWHRAHMEACGCRKPPADIARAIAERDG